MYERELAAFHDTCFADLARHGGTQLVRELRAAGMHRGPVADLGCGGGVSTQVMAREGFEPLGVDPSAAMLALARKRVPSATLQRAALSTMTLPAGLVGIAAINEVLSYDTDIDLDELLATLHASLRPGGLLLLDVAGPGRHSLDEGPTRVFTTAGGTLVMQTEAVGLRLRRDLTLFTKAQRGLWKRTQERHDLRLYHEADVRTGLARAGFVGIRALARYAESDVMFAPHWPAFVAARS